MRSALGTDQFDVVEALGDAQTRFDAVLTWGDRLGPAANQGGYYVDASFSPTAEAHFVALPFDAEAMRAAVWSVLARSRPAAYDATLPVLGPPSPLTRITGGSE